jgi:hypothetical protein
MSGRVLEVFQIITRHFINQLEYCRKKCVGNTCYLKKNILQMASLSFPYFTNLIFCKPKAFSEAASVTIFSSQSRANVSLIRQEKT